MVHEGAAASYLLLQDALVIPSGQGCVWHKTCPGPLELASCPILDEGHYLVPRGDLAFCGHFRQLHCCGGGEGDPLVPHHR